MQLIPGSHWPWRILRQFSPFVVLIVCGALLWSQVNTLDVSQLQAQWFAITPVQWLGAAAFTTLSFWSVGHYDVIAHRQLNTGLPAASAHSSGMTAIALSQTLGFGIVTATLARWRMLRGFGPGVAASITGIVSISFMVLVLFLTAIACLVLPTPSGIAPFAAVAACAMVLTCIFALRFPYIHIRGHRIELLSLRAMAASTGWAFMDVTMACLALWFLIPENVRPDLLEFMPVFFLALCAGLFSGTPAGAGPFELAILALTTATSPAALPAEALLVAVVAFRIVYFLIPALLATLRLVFRPAPVAVWRDPLPPCIDKAPRAEAGVIRQNGGHVQQIGNNFAAIWPTGQALVAMFDPFERAESGFFQQFQIQARERNRFALIYKCSASTAARARASGWQILHSADDAVLDLTAYRTTSPDRSTLRRKLRKANRAGVRVREMIRSDFAHLAAIDEKWQSKCGRARGGTMGRFCPDYIRGQRVFVAEHGGHIVAFASYHTCVREWTLDLMRQSPSAPDGTMHSLVQRAIDVAQSECVPQLSLAAVPACPNPHSAIWRGIAFKIADRAGGAGLRQFKSAFAPRWKPLYIAAPTRWAMAIAIADLAKEVFAPTTRPGRPTASLNDFHEKDENYEVASQAAA